MACCMEPNVIESKAKRQQIQKYTEQQLSISLKNFFNFYFSVGNSQNVIRRKFIIKSARPVNH